MVDLAAIDAEVNGSNVDRKNMLPITLEDLMEERRRKNLACYQRTWDGVVQKMDTASNKQMVVDRCIVANWPRVMALSDAKMAGSGDHSEVDSRNVADATFEGLVEEKLRFEDELKREMEEWKAARLREKLACFQRTKDGVIKKIITPKFSAQQVSKPICSEEIASLIDTSVDTQSSHAFDSRSHAKKQGLLSIEYEGLADMCVEEGRKPFILPSKFHAKTKVDEAEISDACRIQIGEGVDGLTVDSSEHAKVTGDLSPINVIDFENKKVLVRARQRVSTAEKNVIASDEYIATTTKPESTEVKGQLVGKRQKQEEIGGNTVGQIAVETQIRDGAVDELIQVDEGLESRSLKEQEKKLQLHDSGSVIMVEAIPCDMEQAAGSTNFVVKVGTVASGKSNKVRMDKENKRKEAHVVGYKATELKKACNGAARGSVQVGSNIIEEGSPSGVISDNNIIIGTMPCDVQTTEVASTVARLCTGREDKVVVEPRRASHGDRQQAVHQAFVPELGVLQRSEQRGAEQGRGKRRAKFSSGRVHYVNNVVDWDKKARADMI